MLYKTEHGQPTPDWRSLMDSIEERVSRLIGLSHVVIFRDLGDGGGFCPFLIVYKKERRGIDTFFCKETPPDGVDDFN
jgi:hypothetical protein